MAGRRLRSLALGGLLLATLGPALALYKVVAPDGSVTYTDRPPADTRMKVTTLGADPALGGAVAVGEALLPVELRRAAARFPVLLYTTTDCAPCDTGRDWLQQRGIPFAEKRVLNDDDAALLERSVGSRSVPVLTVGAQVLRGLSPLEWASYLDAAGYPRESKLPPGWQPPPPLPLAERTPATRPDTAPTPPESPAAPPADLPPPAPGAIRF